MSVNKVLPPPVSDARPPKLVSKRRPPRVRPVAPQFNLTRRAARPCDPDPLRWSVRRQRNPRRSMTAGAFEAENWVTETVATT